jgi:Ca-activated chloride channel family protein
MAFSSLGLLKFRTTLREVLAILPGFLLLVAFALLLTALARPQDKELRREVEREGLDIMLVVDTSGSMEARDFHRRGRRLTRLAAAKEVIGEFIAARPDDRIGMVVFGEEAFTQVPLTSDHSGMESLLRLVDIGIAGGRGTAVGDAMSIAGRRLDELDAPSKIMILLTDGQSNLGMDPLRAAEALAALDVKVYTIGIGDTQTDAMGPFGLMGSMSEGLDEQNLRAIAETTGGAYFTASDSHSLSKVYDQIDELEPTTAQVREYHHTEERFHPWLLAALAVLALQQLLAQTWLRRLP